MPKKECEERGRSVVELYSSTKTTQKLQTAHIWHTSTVTIVILIKTNIKTNVRSHVILFSSDLDLSYEKVIDYYKLRFQIEFNFRDAKQFWGLEDFMNLGQTSVTNAANLIFLFLWLTYPTIF